MTGESLIVGHRFDVSHLPEAERFAAWAAAITNSHVENLAPDEPFVCTARFWQLGPLVLSEQRTSPVSFHRDEALVRSTPATHFQVTAMLEGVCTMTEPFAAEPIGPGGIHIADLTRPCRVEVGPQRSIAFQIPRPFLFESGGFIDAHGPLPRTGPARLLFSHLHALVGEIETIRAEHAKALARTIRSLLIASLGDLREDRPSPARDLNVRGRVEAHVAAHLEERLEAASICAALNISRSSLYRAFENQGGVLAWARRWRLVAAHLRLDDRSEHRSIAELAYLHGFANAAAFSTSFRREFGYSPSELRRNTASQEPNRPLPESAQAHYRRLLATI